MASSKKCSLCDKAAIRKGLCAGHSSAAWRASHPGYDAGKKTEWRKANPEKNRAFKRAWYERNKEKALAASARWRVDYRDRWLANAAAYRKANAEKVRKSIQEWRRKYPERARVLDANKKARRYAAPGSHTETQLKAMYAHQDGLCKICDCDLGSGYHVDHIYPISRGGSNDISNIQLLCPPCNQHKHDKDPIEHLRSLGRDL